MFNLYDRVLVKAGPKLGASGYIANIIQWKTKTIYQLVEDPTTIFDLQKALVRVAPGWSAGSRIEAMSNYAVIGQENNILEGHLKLQDTSNTTKLKMVLAYPNSKVFNHVPFESNYKRMMRHREQLFPTGKDLITLYADEYQANLESAAYWKSIGLDYLSSSSPDGYLRRGYGQCDSTGYFEYSLD